MVSGIDALAWAKVDGFMAEAFALTERCTGRVGIGDQQGVCRKFRFEGGGQPRLGQGAVAHHETQRLPGTVTRHQHADLFVRDAPFSGDVSTVFRTQG